MLAALLSTLVVASTSAGDASACSSEKQALHVLATWKEEEEPTACPPDEAVALLERRFWDGRHSLLVPLMRAVPTSDGALAEALGSFLGDALQKEPRVFVSRLTRVSPDVRAEACTAAAVADGSGLPEDDAESIRASLRRMAAGADGELARRCLTAFEAGADSTRDEQAMRSAMRPAMRHAPRAP